MVWSRSKDGSRKETETIEARPERKRRRGRPRLEWKEYIKLATGWEEEHLVQDKTEFRKYLKTPTLDGKLER